MIDRQLIREFKNERIWLILHLIKHGAKLWLTSELEIKGKIKEVTLCDHEILELYYILRIVHKSKLLKKSKRGKILRTVKLLRVILPELTFKRKVNCDLSDFRHTEIKSFVEYWRKE